MEPVYNGYFGTSRKWPDYQSVQVSLYGKAPFRTTTMCKCVDYVGALLDIQLPARLYNAVS